MIPKMGEGERGIDFHTKLRISTIGGALIQFGLLLATDSGEREINLEKITRRSGAGPM